MAKKLQMCGTEEEMRESAARICRDYLHGAWKSVKPQELDFKRISGGLSNFLYYVALPDDAGTKLRAAYEPRERSPDDKEKDKSPVGRVLRQRTLSRSNSFNMDEPKKVLLRIYGQVHGERALDAIVTESVIFTLLSERKLGPKLHGVFSGGRIEEYIPARSLYTKELSEPALSMKIAEKMASIHSMDVPLMKEPNWLWKTMSKWLKTVDERLATVQPKDENEERLVRRLKQVQFDQEIEWLKRYISGVESPVLFCHNDMQEGNILLLEEIPQPTSDDETSNFAPDDSLTDADRPTAKSKENNHTASPKAKTTLDTLRMQFAGENTTDSMSSHISDNGEPKLVLIDFEYCAYNYRGFDIANHFQEWMYDYTNPEYPFYFECRESCPTLEQKEIFIREYLKHYLATTSEDADEDTTPTIEDVNQLLSEVEAFSLASHLLWTLWSAVNATKSKITFGYWDYGVARVEMYFRLKQEVIKKEKYGFPQKRKICEVDI